MSANATKLPLNIECFMEEKDVSSSMCRADFEEMSAPLFQRVEMVLQKCLDDSSRFFSKLTQHTCIISALFFNCNCFMQN